MSAHIYQCIEFPDMCEDTVFYSNLALPQPKKKKKKEGKGKINDFYILASQKGISSKYVLEICIHVHIGPDAQERKHVVFKQE